MTNTFTMFVVIFLDFTLRTWTQCTFLVLRFLCLFVWMLSIEAIFFRQYAGIFRHIQSITYKYNTPLDTLPQPIWGVYMHCL